MATWLCQQQAANGRIGSNAMHDFIYGHAIATCALCEVAGLSGDEPLRGAAQKALDYLELQAPEDAEDRFGFPASWARRWPSEQVWKLRKR